MTTKSMTKKMIAALLKAQCQDCGYPLSGPSACRCIGRSEAYVRAHANTLKGLGRQKLVKWPLRIGAGYLTAAGIKRHKAEYKKVKEVEAARMPSNHMAELTRIFNRLTLDQQKCMRALFTRASGWQNSTCPTFVNARSAGSLAKKGYLEMRITIRASKRRNSRKEYTERWYKLSEKGEKLMTAVDIQGALHDEQA